MITYNMEFGINENRCYVALQPPVTDSNIVQAISKIHRDKLSRSGTEVVNPRSEHAFNLWTFTHSPDLSVADIEKQIKIVGEKISEIIRGQGREVLVHGAIKAVDFQNEFFIEQASDATS